MFGVSSWVIYRRWGHHQARGWGCGLGSGLGWGPRRGGHRRGGHCEWDDRRQGPSLNKDWVGGGLCPPTPPPPGLLSHYDDGRGWRRSMAELGGAPLFLLLHLCSLALAAGRVAGGESGRGRGAPGIPPCSA